MTKLMISMLRLQQNRQLKRLNPMQLLKPQSWI